MTTTVGFDRGGVQSSADLLRTERLRIARDEPGLIPRGRGWEPASREMAELCADCPDTIGDVLRMLTRAQEILNLLPPPAANRVASFNSLYFTITDRVAQSLRGTEVRDPSFLELLDIEFAKRYFEALRLWGDEDRSTPDAWEILFRRAQDPGVSKLAAAMLGVNAHINHDLALALTSTWEQLGAPRDEVVHPDYLLVNKIFYQEIPRLRRRYSTRFQLRIDGLLGDLDDWSQRVLVAATRAHAWEQAQRLWELRDDEDDLARAKLVMDRASAYVGELLITGDGVVNRTGAVLRAGRDTTRSSLRRLFGRARH
ncbi:hypothetical protein Asp14428_02870 [Actinoplanes sp. NBRC 14428]|uniref:Uncharacterized protein n=1 Tax=Pseudosporangium ferrugineum TaxID=439699 RepID=A0A2T0SIE8_9ACTN|nr:DUF5995 family protein [Pseudosporangium ferrugineum]PRY33195.1 hypothetical protein CLV70_101357 [Pseudosporangium ferrugineum]BCJ48812.1 hypothetical protein Asp14428_02870 [Actinoplanes sp. NBRC 14428]